MMRLLSKLVSIFFLVLFGSFNPFYPDQKNNAQPLTFVLLTDLHVTPGSASDYALNDLVDEINTTEIDFIIVSGDLSNTGSDEELYAVKQALDKLVKPCYVLPGNHETNWAESAGLTINRLWGNDRFAFRHKGFFFIGFNTGPYMKMGDGHIKQEDLAWMKRLLSTRLRDETLVSISHYPLSDGLDNWPQATEILKTAGCRLALCGHGHSLRLYNFNGIPGIMGRSVILGKSPVPGYNLIHLRNDSVIVYNKALSEKLAKPAICLSYSKPDTISRMSVSPFPDYSINKAYRNYKILAELSDTSSIFSGPCLVNDSIIVYGNSLGYLKSLNIRTNKMIWQTKIAGPVYSTPVSADGIIILGTIDGKITGIDGLKGSILWEVKTGRPALAEGTIEEGYVYIGGGDRNFYKIDYHTGKVLWQSQVEGLIQGKPAISATTVLFGAWDRHLYCLDKMTGQLNWKWNNGRPQVLYSPGNIFPASSYDRVFIVAPDRFMTAIDITTGKQIWRTNRHQVRESMGASPDGSLIYAKLMNDTIIAVSALEDYPLTVWTTDAGFGYEHNPCPVSVTGQELVAGTRDGMLIVIDPETRKVMWKYKAGTSSVNKIVADATGTLWCTLMEGKLLGIRTIEIN
jgi:outer membrane protein assembly factor BamB/predicted MPP superfamily phosphohydrolase